MQASCIVVTLIVTCNLRSYILVVDGGETLHHLGPPEYGHYALNPKPTYSYSRQYANKPVATKFFPKQLCNRLTYWFSVGNKEIY